MISKEDLFPVGKFGRPHGVNGELPLMTHRGNVFDTPDSPYVVCEMDGIPVPFFLESYRTKGRGVILVKLVGVNDIEATRRFVNRTVYVPADFLGALPEEAVSWRLLEGYMIDDERFGEIGQVIRVDDSTLNVLLCVKREQGELLIPIAPALIRSVDLTSRRITIALPDGLSDI
jgi:16S rRNA processing protein RimM